jgi:[phosphatase 2A protein]-leucine-carboxy methyltransferase
MPFLSVGYHLLFCLFFLFCEIVTLIWYLQSLTGGGGTTLRAPVYNLFPVDLRTPPATSLATLLGSGDEPLLSPALPTLLLFECVLAYMNPTASNALIQWFVDYFSAPGGGLLGGIVYEMFKLNDAFGRVMLNNLKVTFSPSYTV